MARFPLSWSLRGSAQRVFVIGSLLGLVGPVPAALAGGPTGQAVPDSFEGVYDMRGALMEDGSQRIFHMLVDGPNETELQLPSGMELPRGAKIRARGQRVQAGALEVTDFEVVEPAPLPTIDPEPRPPRRIATIIVFWDSQGINNPGARDSMFLDSKSTNVFYGENSYGMDMMAGNVFGPYKIDAPSGCNSSYIASEARAAFTAKGHDEKDYRQFMYHFGSGLNCGWSGLGSIGTPDEPAADSWYNNTFGCVVRNQELAHNYGLFHSRGFVCPNGDNSTCLPPTSAGNDYPTNLEYGDPWTPLGNGCHHFTVSEKLRMGYLEGCNVVTATDSGTFNLLPTELPCNGTQALRLPTNDGRNYVLEYRRSIGSFDLGLEGVLLHVSNTSGSSNWWVDVGDQGRLHTGDSFADPNGAWSFTITEENDSHAVIDVQFVNGSGQGPQCMGGSAPGMEVGNIGTLECAAEPFPLDTQPPTVEITYPPNNQYFDVGANFNITAEAMDDRQVTELELYSLGEPVFKVFSNPGEWEVTNIPMGVYDFGVVASDGPNFGQSEPVVIYVGVDPPDGGSTGGSTGGATDSGTTEVTAGTDGDTDTDGDTGNMTGEKSGCACTTTPHGLPGAAWLAGLGIWGVRLRRRPRG